MHMGSSSLLSFSVLVLLFSISSAYTSNRNPIRIIKNNGMEAKNNQQSGKSQNIIVGPWGTQVNNSNGLAFDDGAYTGIRAINLAYNDDAIGGLQVTYDLNGSPFIGENHESFITGFKQVTMSFDFPSEFIVEVSGYTGIVSGYTVICSLTFKTNKATYGPYGVTSGTAFNLSIENGLVVGFKGSIGYWMDYIKIYLSL